MSSEKKSILLHHFDLHQRHGVSASSPAEMIYIPSDTYVMPLLYFAMQRCTTGSLLGILAIFRTTNTVSSYFDAVWDNCFFSGIFEIFVVSVL